MRLAKPDLHPAPAPFADRPLQERLLDWTLAYPFNLAGVVPAASIPCGFTAVGLQIIGCRHADTTVLTASAAFERARPWAHLRPPVGRR